MDSEEERDKISGVHCDKIKKNPFILFTSSYIKVIDQDGDVQKLY